MSLATGARIGVYEIVGLLGTGGMGEVYRARDATLNREVAIKVLLAAVANDPDRLARFKREAQVLASLNHPNIAHVHGFEDSPPSAGQASVRALVMELVEGPTLADRIARAAIPLDEALPIAKQIAEALEAAHQQGIIHRDLKPANIKVRPDGTVKVLDFGLAKALDPIGPDDHASGSLPVLPTQSPTITSPALTLRGVILGTAAYMSPEQAKGRVTDTRTDIWAFGCVLFEMLTGVRAFRGEDVADTMVAVLSREPDWPLLPADAVTVRPLLARCLRKDSRQRLQAIGDARIELDELANGALQPAAPKVAMRERRRLTQVAAAVLAAGVLAALTMWGFTRQGSAPDARPVRFEVIPPPSHAPAINIADRNIAISPDGLSIVYRSGTETRLAVRALDRLDTRILEGTAGARYPFFSPDGQWVAFFDGTTLKRVSMAGGPPLTICQSPIPRGGSWGDDGDIVFATQDTATGLLRVSAAGGDPQVLTRPDSTAGERDHAQLSLLPNGRGVLFTVVPVNPAEPPQVAVLDLTTGQRKTLVRGGSLPEYVATGHLVYAVAGTLSAVRFDPDRLEVLSDPVVLVENVSMIQRGGGAADYALSRRGTLVYVPADIEGPRSLVWVDRTGQEAPTGAPQHLYAAPRVSPDGTRIAVEIRDQRNDIHVFDVRRRTLMRLAPSASVESNPIWTEDGLRIVFASERDDVSNLYVHSADGTGAVERLTRRPDSPLPAWVAPDGSGLLATVISPKTAGDVVWFPFKAPFLQATAASTTSADSPVEPLVQSPGIDYLPAVSPNGRYVAYQSNESGRPEVYVRPFPRVNDGVWPVTTAGGSRPVWGRNGRELFYVDALNVLTAVPVESSSAKFVFGNATRLFEMVVDGQAYRRDYDVAPDGRFLTVKESGREIRPRALVVVLNWQEELKARLSNAQERRTP